MIVLRAPGLPPASLAQPALLRWQPPPRQTPARAGSKASPPQTACGATSKMAMVVADASVSEAGSAALTFLKRVAPNENGHPPIQAPWPPPPSVSPAEAELLLAEDLGQADFKPPPHPMADLLADCNKVSFKVDESSSGDESS